MAVLLGDVGVAPVTVGVCPALYRLCKFKETGTSVGLVGAVIAAGSFSLYCCVDGEPSVFDRPPGLPSMNLREIYWPCCEKLILFCSMTIGTVSRE